MSTGRVWKKIQVWGSQTGGALAERFGSKRVTMAWDRAGRNVTGRVWMFCTWTVNRARKEGAINLGEYQRQGLTGRR